MMRKKSRSNRGRERTVANRSREVAEENDVASRQHTTTLNINALAQITQYRGALVPASALRAYEDLIPGSANRVFTVFEDQARHRMDLEKRVVFSSIGHERLGILCALVLGLTGLVGSGFLIWSGKSLEGLAIVLAEIGTIIWVFLRTTRVRKDERIEKAKVQEMLRADRKVPEPEMGEPSP